MRRYVPAVLLAITACANGSSPSIAITATDTECRVAKTHLDAGDTTFKVKNDGKDVTEVYVYEGTRVVTEKEDIGPGTSASFEVDLAPGDYEVACKPGQKGDGIRTALHVTGERKAGDEPKAADREIEFEAKDFAFDGLDGVSIKAGETVKFEMENEGPSEHEFEVLRPDGTSLGEIGHTPKDEDGEATLTFDKTGTYIYLCAIDDHAAKGMKGSFVVA